MNILELTKLALSFDDLSVRQWVKDAKRSAFKNVDWSFPIDADETELNVAAAITELLCEKFNLSCPAWTESVGPAAADVFLELSAIDNPKLKKLLVRDSPEPLKKRNIFAPSLYLEVL